MKKAGAFAPAFFCFIGSRFQGCARVRTRRTYAQTGISAYRAPARKLAIASEVRKGRL